MANHAVTIITSLILALMLPLAAHARITRIDIEKVETTFDGAVTPLLNEERMFTDAQVRCPARRDACHRMDRYPSR